MNATPAPANPYMLFFRNTGPEIFRPLSAAQRQTLINDWNSWFEGLLADGRAVEGQPLELETRVVSGPAGGRVTDGPFPEAKEAIGGYVLLTVTSLDEATAIAQRHPALAHGMIIEVRQLAGGCHLGVTTTARNRQVQVAANA
jgi:hypothetical protein